MRDQQFREDTRKWLDLLVRACLSVCLSCNAESHLHALMCSVSVVTVVFIHTMKDDQRINTLVHEGDALCIVRSLKIAVERVHTLCTVLLTICSPDM